MRVCGCGCWVCVSAEAPPTGCKDTQCVPQHDKSYTAFAWLHVMYQCHDSPQCRHGATCGCVDAAAGCVCLRRHRPLAARTPNVCHSMTNRTQPLHGCMSCTSAMIAHSAAMAPHAGVWMRLLGVCVCGGTALWQHGHPMCATA